MRDAVPEAVFPEDDPYPAYRIPVAIAVERPKRLAIDEYILAAVVASGTVLADQKFSRRITEL
jgi:hypothetical protein